MEIEEDKLYAYFKQIKSIIKNGGVEVMLLQNNDILLRKFDCIIKSSLKHMDLENTPNLMDINLSDLVLDWERELRLFNENLAKIDLRLTKSVNILLIHISDMRKTLYCKMYDALLLNDNVDYSVSCYISLLMIKRAMINLRNIFID